MASCEDVILCRFAEERDAYVSALLSSSRHTTVPDFSIPARSSLAKWLRVNEECLPIPDDRGVTDFLSSKERELLEELSVRLCVPLISDGRLVAILLLAASSRNWHLEAADSGFLVECGHHAALACEAVALRRAAAERLRTAHRAQQLVVAGQLAASVAHEVRNPLSAIRSTIQYVITGKADWPQKVALLEDILCEVDRIEATVSGILNLSRPRTLELSDVDLIEVATESTKLVQAYAESQHVVIDCQFETPVAVVGDARELRQVFLNLLLNACQAMATGGHVRMSSDLATRHNHGVPGQERLLSPVSVPA